MSSSTLSIHAVLFDLDGLLIDSEPIWQESEIQVFGELGLFLDRKKCMQTMGLRLDEVVRYWRQQQPDWRCRESDDTIVARVLKEVKRRILESGEPMPGAISLVQRLQEKLPLGLASSSYMEIIECALQRMNLSDAFQVVHSAQHEERGKPAPDVYLSAAKSLNIAPNHCLVIEDS
ncbi:MAG: HAD-IA family hydrolase, partial [Leptospiraceae bacterium]|nr:HAD-IA family hydrolase [Leptospiraceae bacterium]